MRKIIIIALGFGLCCLFSCSKEGQSGNKVKFTPDYSAITTLLDSSKVILDSAAARDITSEAKTAFQKEYNDFKNLNTSELTTHEALSAVVWDYLSCISTVNGSKLDSSSVWTALKTAEEIEKEFKGSADEEVQEALKKMKESAKEADKLFKQVSERMKMKPNDKKDMPCFEQTPVNEAVKKLNEALDAFSDLEP